MSSWPVQDAKARFSELLDTTIKKGPQIVTRRGVEEAVLVPIAEWRHLAQAARPSLKEFLLGPGPRFENLVTRRRNHKRRPAVEFK
ncbi:MAG TPA: type II toxin-antitoxin system Phd/YefM family antitoxin [Terriglobia bacterium]|nr:type II toxin-antitoxin system Phd/YefM family antitoxin [Terriglobia bacterium]